MKIKKGWKITWITLGSLLGLIVLVVGVALYVVSTPKHLTKIVNNLAGDFINCEAHFENVDLTLLSTFPDVGLEVKNVVLVNKMEGAPYDTLAHIENLTLGVDLKAYLFDDRVIVHQVLVDGVEAHLFINKDGKANFDIFPSSEEEDTSATQLPELIDVRKVELNHVCLTYDDDLSGMNARVDNLAMALNGEMEGDKIDADLSMGIPRVSLKMHTSGSGERMQVSVKDLSVNMGGQKKGEALIASLLLGSEEINFDMSDSLGQPALKSRLDDLEMALLWKGTSGELDVDIRKGLLNVGGTEMVNNTLQASSHKLLTARLPFAVDRNDMRITLESSELQLDEYKLLLEGMAQLASENTPLTVDMKVQTDGAWQLKPLLAIIPDSYAGFKKGMDVDGRVSLAATAKGTLTDTTMPMVDARVQMEGGRFSYPAALPYTLYNIRGDVAAHVDMSRGGVSGARIHRLSAQTQGSKVSVTGRADNLMGDMKVDAHVIGALPLEDLLPLVPEGMAVDALGDADLDVQACFTMSQLKRQALDQMKATGSLKLANVDVTLDSIHASVPQFDLSLQLPSKAWDNKVADVTLKTQKVRMESGNSINAKLEYADINIGVNNLLKETLQAAWGISLGEAEAKMAETQFSSGGLTCAGEMYLDTTETHPLRRFNPRFHFFTNNAVLSNPDLPDALRMAEFDVNYDENIFDLKSAQLQLSHTDCELYGTVENFREWLADKAMLHGDLNFKSSYTDVDQLMNLFSGVGTDKDSLEAMRREDTVPADANPFIVPKNVDITFNTHIQRSVAFGNDLNDVAGSLTVKDGQAILDQMGFVCKAARMQLTAYYRSPRPNHLFTAIDFHLLDIEIDELINMIPTIDTLVPMLKAFNGNANFHLAGETYLNARYQPKMSTLLGSAAISGKNLVVMDNASISNIAKLIGMKSWKEKDDKIRIDSMDVEMTCFRKEIEVYPFLLNMGSYHFCVSGTHNLDNKCNYHIELLKHPLLFKVGVDIKGSLDNPKISLGSVRYSDFYKPEVKGAAGKKALELKAMIREALEKNVR